MKNNELGFESLYMHGMGGASIDDHPRSISVEAYDGFEDAASIELAHAMESLDFMGTYEAINSKITADKIRMCKRLAVNYGKNSSLLNKQAANSIESLCLQHSLEAETEAVSDTGTQVNEKPGTEQTKKKQGFFAKIWAGIVAVFKAIVKFFKSIPGKIKSFFSREREAKVNAALAEAKATISTPETRSKLDSLEGIEFGEGKISDLTTSAEATKFSEDCQSFAQEFNKVVGEVRKIKSVNYDTQKTKQEWGAFQETAETKAQKRDAAWSDANNKVTQICKPLLDRVVKVVRDIKMYGGLSQIKFQENNLKGMIQYFNDIATNASTATRDEFLKKKNLLSKNDIETMIKNGSYKETKSEVVNAVGALTGDRMTNALELVTKCAEELQHMYDDKNMRANEYTNDYAKCLAAACKAFSKCATSVIKYTQASMKQFMMTDAQIVKLFASTGDSMKGIKTKVKR